MEFRFETAYSQEAVTAMAKALRKTVRKKRSRRSHIAGVIIIVLGLFLALRELPAFSLRSTVTLLAALAVALVLLFEDAINGYLARRRMLVGTDRAVSVFTGEGYTSTTAIGETAFHYENIAAIAETERYFVFLFSQNHAQIYDKRTLSGGSAADFRAFLAEKTGKAVQTVK